MKKSNKNIGYVYTEELSNYSYGDKHPMKIERAVMTHDLLYHMNILDKFDYWVNSKFSASN